jgi:hypothetical protein
VQGLGQSEEISGVSAVSRWLRALSSTVVLNQTSGGVCEDIGHGHGYRVAFRGNVHHNEGESDEPDECSNSSLECIYYD